MPALETLGTHCAENAGASSSCTSTPLPVGLWVPPRESSNARLTALQPRQENTDYTDNAQMGWLSSRSSNALANVWAVCAPWRTPTRWAVFCASFFAKVCPFRILCLRDKEVTEDFPFTCQAASALPQRHPGGIWEVIYLHWDSLAWALPGELEGFGHLSKMCFFGFSGKGHASQAAATYWEMNLDN